MFAESLIESAAGDHSTNRGWTTIASIALQVMLLSALAISPIVYPAMAVQTRTQGTVILHALISKDGSIESLQVVSGHPFLARAALDAVRQWRYRPYILNGQPIEVETQVTVNFTLGKD